MLGMRLQGGHPKHGGGKKPQTLHHNLMRSDLSGDASGGESDRASGGVSAPKLQLQDA